MAVKEQTIQDAVANPLVEKWDKKYAKCDVCGEFLHTLPISIFIKKSWYYYAEVIRCSKCNKFFGIRFKYASDMPKEIDDNDIRERIKKHQHSAFACRNYDLSEIKLGKICTPRQDENFEEFKARYKSFREDYYKGVEENEKDKSI